MRWKYLTGQGKTGSPPKSIHRRLWLSHLSVIPYFNEVVQLFSALPTSRFCLSWSVVLQTLSTPAVLLKKRNCICPLLVVLVSDRGMPSAVTSFVFFCSHYQLLIKNKIKTLLTATNFPPSHYPLSDIGIHTLFSQEMWLCHGGYVVHVIYSSQTAALFFLDLCATPFSGSHCFCCHVLCQCMR